MYIPQNDTQIYPLDKLRLVVEKFKLNAWKNQNLLKSPKFLSQRIRKHYYKTFGTGIINSFWVELLIVYLMSRMRMICRQSRVGMCIVFHTQSRQIHGLLLYPDTYKKISTYKILAAMPLEAFRCPESERMRGKLASIL